MARKHRNRDAQARRPNTSLATTQKTLLRAPLVSPASRSLILDLEDRREYHPENVHRPPRSLSRDSRRLVPTFTSSTTLDNEATGRRKRAAFKVPQTLSFRLPKEVSLCVRRHQRREVIFALKKNGKGSRSRFRRRNKWSDIKC